MYCFKKCNVAAYCQRDTHHTLLQAPVVQKLDTAIHRINLYPVDKY